MQANKPLSVSTFFSDYIFHPDHAPREDQTKCLILSIALGILSCGIIPLAVGISWGIRWLISYSRDKRSEAEEKVNQTASKHFGRNPVVATARAGFPNAGNTCFLASALHCLASIRKHLTMIDDTVANEKQTSRQTLNKTLAQLDTILSGNQGSLGELKNELGLGDDGGDLRLIIQRLLPCFKTGETKCYFNNNWSPAGNPINLKEGKGLLSEGSDIYPHPLRNEKGEKSDFLVFTRMGLDSKRGDRKPMEIPPTIKVAIDEEKKQLCEYELVTTGQSLGGHAIAYVKENDKWFILDDAKRIPTTYKDIADEINKDGAILVYRLKQV